jgi:hypothetical protein
MAYIIYALVANKEWNTPLREIPLAEGKLMGLKLLEKVEKSDYKSFTHEKKYPSNYPYSR